MSFGDGRIVPDWLTRAINEYMNHDSLELVSAPTPCTNLRSSPCYGKMQYFSRDRNTALDAPST